MVETEVQLKVGYKANRVYLLSVVDVRGTVHELDLYHDELQKLVDSANRSMRTQEFWSLRKER